MDVVIEIISRTRRVLDKYRYTKNRITIGRAYDNDLIITDPHVSPHHAILHEQDNGKWLMEDLDSKNGIYTGNHIRVDKNLHIESGAVLQLGKTHLRVFDRQHQVEDAIILSPVEKVIQPLSNIGIAILFTIITLAIFSFDSYLELYNTFELKLIFSDVLAYAAAGLSWALVWSFIGRVIKHDPRFPAQLGSVMIYLATVLIIDNLVVLIDYNTSAGYVITAITSVCHFLLGAALLWLNFYLATNQSPGKRIAISTGIAATVIGLSLFMQFLNEPDFMYAPQYDDSLKPPAFYWGTPVAGEEFLNNAEEIFIGVDEEREAD